MSSPVTVTATVFDPGNNLLQGNAFVRFRLRNFDGLVPIVSGTGVFAETQIDAFPNASGAVSQTLWGNNSINGNTYYTVEFHNNGRITSSGNYNISGSTNLNTAATISPSPVPSGPNTIIFQNNGAMNSSQTTLNLENTDGSLTITDVGGGTLNLQGYGGTEFGTSGKGWFFGGDSYTPVVDSTGGYFPVNSNQVWCVQLILQSKWVISSLAVFVITGSTGAFTAGLFDATGTTKLIDAGANAFNLTSSQRYLKVTLGSSVTLNPGVYWFVFGGPSTSNGSVITHTGPTQWIQQLFNGLDISNPQVLPTRFGLAANAISGGALPSTLGAITPVSDAMTTINIPAVMFQV
jgi:hypothetical protein